MTASTIQVRDARKSNFFWAPNELIKRDGATLGVYGIAIYCALAAFADNENNTAFPSVATLAKTIGCSANKVREALSKLCDMKWIRSEARVTETDDGNTRFLSNLYYLLPTPGEVSQGEVPHTVSKGTAHGEVGVLHDSDQGTSQGEHDLYPLNNTQVTTPTEPKDSGAQPAVSTVTDPPSPAQPDATPKKKRARAAKPKEEKPKEPRQPDPAFDVIAERLFNAPPGSPALKDKSLCTRIGMVKSALHNAEITIGQFVDACSWYRQSTGLSLPRDPGKVVTMVLDYRAGHKADEDVVYANGMTRAQAKAASAETVAAYQGEDQAARAVMESIMNGTYQPQEANS